MEMRLAFNMLAIVGCGAFAGLMLNIGLTLGAYWKSLSPAEFLAWFGANSHLVGRTIPFVAVPAILGILGSLWFAGGHDRLLWGVALAAVAALMLVTVAWHLPTNAAFVAGSVPLGDVPATLDRWLLLHWLRIALGFSAAIAGVAALAR